MAPLPSVWHKQLRGRKCLPRSCRRSQQRWEGTPGDEQGTGVSCPPGQLPPGRCGPGQRCSGPRVRPSHLQDCGGPLSPPPRPVVGALPPSGAWAHVEVMGLVDSCVKGISQAQGVSLEQEGRIFQHCTPLMGLHHERLPESPPLQSSGPPALSFFQPLSLQPIVPSYTVAPSLSTSSSPAQPRPGSPAPETTSSFLLLLPRHFPAH